MNQLGCSHLFVCWLSLDTTVPLLRNKNPECFLPILLVLFFSCSGALFVLPNWAFCRIFKLASPCFFGEFCPHSPPKYVGVFFLPAPY